MPEIDWERVKLLDLQADLPWEEGSDGIPAVRGYVVPAGCVVVARGFKGDDRLTTVGTEGDTVWAYDAPNGLEVTVR